MKEEQDAELRKLFVEAHAGSQEAYASALKTCSEILRSFARCRMKNRDAVEDVVQESLLSIHRARHSYDPSKPFAPWFFAIARSRLCDHLRKERRNNVFEFREIDQIEQEAVPLESSNGAEILSSLPEKQRKVLELLKVEDLSVKEVSKRLNMSESAVKVTAHRAYKRLRKENISAKS